MNSSPEIDHRVGLIEGELKQVVAAIGSLVKSIEVIRSEISQDVKMLSDRLATRTTPNFSIMASWAGVVIGVVGLLMTPTAFYFTREFNRLEKTYDSLDSKFQHEQRLIKDTVTSEIVANEKRVDTLEQWTIGQVKADLDELRALRRTKAP